MVVLIKRLILFLSIISFNCYGYFINEVQVNCINLGDCDAFAESLEEVIGKEMSEKDIKDQLRFLSLDPSLKKLSYELIKIKQTTLLNINIEKKQKIDEVDVSFKANFDIDDILSIEEVRQQLSIKKGVYYSDKEEILSRKILKKFLFDKGVSEYKVNFYKKYKNNLVLYDVNIEILALQKIKNIKIKSQSIQKKDIIFFNDFIGEFKGKNWDRLKVKLSIDKLSSNLFESGYYFSKVNPEFIEIDSNNVDIVLHIDFGPQISMIFKGSSYFSRQEFMKYIRDQIKTDSSKLSELGIKSSISEMYKNVGVYNTEVSMRIENGITKFKDKYQYYFIQINEGHKIKIDKFELLGVRKVAITELMKLYYEEGDALIESGYLKEKYLENYKTKVKEHYLNKGYLFVEISEPKIIINNKSAEVSFAIKEQRQTIVNKINLRGVPEEIKSTLLKKLNNVPGENFKVLNLEKDLEILLNDIKNYGYYFAKFKTLKEKDVLKYSKDFTLVDINFDIQLNNLARLNKIIVTGNETTKHYVVKREVHIKKGDLITPTAINESRNRINALGLFNTVRFKLFEVKGSTSNDYDLIIYVNERDFGLGEISLGYRTDTGVRGAAGVNYNNIVGRNWTLSGKAEVNYRLNLDTLDKERRDQGLRFIEWDVNVGMLFPYLSDLPVRSEISTSYKKQRYKSLDATILTLQLQEAVDINKNISLSLKYQFDSVNQFDATNDDFNDNFQIGSITPSINLDFRDDPINPKKGSYFGLSWEFANPTLFSNDDPDLVVNFDKLTSRNKFYYPLGPFYGLALSISAGKETNRATDPLLDSSGNRQYDNGTLVTKGYIPSIRVFRLDGQDTVRGFSDAEINLLGTGEDISSVAIRDSAYFLNMKFEARKFINDLMIAGLFLDAGRIYINSFKPLDLRSSFGTTFKFVTPVGSLDFDYGVKFRRAEFSNGSKETFGRFHLSIGFF